MSGQKAELKTLKSVEQDQEVLGQKTDVARICKVETTVQLAECDRDVKEELIEASLEEYQ